MAQRSTYNVTRTPAVVNPESVDVDRGFHINWGEVVNTDENGNKEMDAGTIVSFKGGGIFPRKKAELQVDSLVADAGGTATATTANAHGLEVGDHVTITGSSNFDVTRAEVTAVPSNTTFEYELGSDPADETGGSVATAISEAVGILITYINEDADHRALNGVGVYVGGIFFSNLLPDNGDSNFDTMLNELQAFGRNTYGTGYAWRNFSDTRSS